MTVNKLQNYFIITKSNDHSQLIVTQKHNWTSLNSHVTTVVSSVSYVWLMLHYTTAILKDAQIARKRRACTIQISWETQWDIKYMSWSGFECWMAPWSLKLFSSTRTMNSWWTVRWPLTVRLIMKAFRIQVKTMILYEWFELRGYSLVIVCVCSEKWTLPFRSKTLIESN